MIAKNKRLVSHAEAAKYLADAGIPCSVRTIRRWVTEGRLPGWQMGPQRVFVDLADVEKLIRPRQRATTGATSAR